MTTGPTPDQPANDPLSSSAAGPGPGAGSGDSPGPGPGPRPGYWPGPGGGPGPRPGDWPNPGPAPSTRLGRLWQFLHTQNGVIGAVAGVLGLLLSIIAYIQATNGDSANLESVSFVIDRPANIEQAVQDESQMARVVGPDSELIYPVDVTVLNSGNQAAVIAEISVEFTDIFELEYCGTKAQGGGGGLFVSALYDFEFENLTAAAELPVDITQSTRLEVPAHENTRFELSIGPKYMSETELLYVYVFNIYLREAGTDTKVILGQGASLSSVESADAFIGQIPELARGYEECMRRNAGEISRIVALPDATSPKLTELDNALKRYR